MPRSRHKKEKAVLNEYIARAIEPTLCLSAHFMSELSQMNAHFPGFVIETAP